MLFLREQCSINLILFLSPSIKVHIPLIHVYNLIFPNLGHFAPNKKTRPEDIKSAWIVACPRASVYLHAHVHEFAPNAYMDKNVRNEENSYS